MVIQLFWKNGDLSLLNNNIIVDEKERQGTKAKRAGSKIHYSVPCAEAECSSVVNESAVLGDQIALVIPEFGVLSVLGE